VVTYSKSKVDRAGQLLADSLRTATRERREIVSVTAELLEAVGIVDWWRAEHARPLSRVAANLRY